MVILTNFFLFIHLKTNLFIFLELCPHSDTYSLPGVMRHGICVGVVKCGMGANACTTLNQDKGEAFIIEKGILERHFLKLKLSKPKTQLTINLKVMLCSAQ